MINIIASKKGLIEVYSFDLKLQKSDIFTKY